MVETKSAKKEKKIKKKMVEAHTYTASPILQYCIVYTFFTFSCHPLFSALFQHYLTTEDNVGRTKKEKN